jgi:hypothetical protein
MIRECLGLQKIRGKWRICHGLDYDVFPDREHWTPITECSAQVRVEAAEHLDKLREAVVKSAENFISRVDEAIEALAEVVKHPVRVKNSDALADRAKLNGHSK